MKRTTGAGVHIGRGRRPQPTVSERTSEAIADALDASTVELQVLAERLCDEPPCRHDPYPFCGRVWLWRARSASRMIREHARCILFRAEELRALGKPELHRLSLMVSRDEPAPTPPTLAVYPESSQAVAEEVARVVYSALPALGRGGKKRRDLETALRKYFALREVPNYRTWQAILADTSAMPEWAVRLLRRSQVR